MPSSDAISSNSVKARDQCHLLADRRIDGVRLDDQDIIAYDDLSGVRVGAQGSHDGGAAWSDADHIAMNQANYGAFTPDGLAFLGTYLGAGTRFVAGLVPVAR